MLVPLHRARQLLDIGLPIIAGMISGILLGLIDTAMVGVLGVTALGAVGLAAFASHIFLGLFHGFAVAVQALVSRRVGQGREDECSVPLQGGLVIVVLAALPLSALLWYFIPSLFVLINDDPEVIAIGVDYIRWLILQAVFVGIIAANSGFWNGVGRSRIYIPAILLMHFLNVVFNYMFIFGEWGAPRMEAEGAGFATFLAHMVGACAFIALGVRRGGAYGFLRRWVNLTELKSIISLAIPAGLQQVLDVAALTATYSIVGRVGTQELACYAVLINLVGLVGLPAWGFGTAGATLVGQAIGRGQLDDARQWAWDAIKVGMALMFILGMPLWLFPETLLSIWIHDSETRALGIWPVRILGLMIAINGVGYMMAMMLNGAGDVKRVMVINLVTQWIVLVPGAFVMGPLLGFGLLGIWLLHQFVYRLGNVFIFSYMWRRGDWSRITI